MILRVMVTIQSSQLLNADLYKHGILCSCTFTDVIYLDTPGPISFATSQLLGHGFDLDLGILFLCRVLHVVSDLQTGV